MTQAGLCPCTAYRPATPSPQPEPTGLVERVRHGGPIELSQAAAEQAALACADWLEGEGRAVEVALQRRVWRISPGEAGRTSESLVARGVGPGAKLPAGLDQVGDETVGYGFLVRGSRGFMGTSDPEAGGWFTLVARVWVAGYGWRAGEPVSCPGGDLVLAFDPRNAVRLVGRGV